jgi:hypothetical protein
LLAFVVTSQNEQRTRSEGDYPEDEGDPVEGGSRPEEEVKRDCEWQRNCNECVAERSPSPRRPRPWRTPGGYGNYRKGGKTEEQG